MPHEDSDGSGIEHLAVFAGEWDLQAEFPGVAREDARGSAAFQWMAGQRLLVQHVTVAHPDAPDSLAVLAENPKRAGEFLQHYFDSRGVVRLYDMTFGHQLDAVPNPAGLPPLHFQQRFIGTFSPNRNTIDGQWEICEDGVNWRVDFPLAFRRR